MYPTKTDKRVEIQVALHKVREGQWHRAMELDNEEVKEVPKEESPKEKVNKGKKKKS